MAATASPVGSVPVPSSVSRGATVRPGPSAGGGNGSLSAMVEAIVGGAPVHSRGSGERPSMDDFGAHAGDHGDQGAHATRAQARGRDAAREAGGAEPGAFVVTPFLVDQIAGRTAAGDAAVPLPVLSQITYGIGVYDRAVQAVAGHQSSDLLGRRLDRAL